MPLFDFLLAVLAQKVARWRKFCPSSPHRKSSLSPPQWSQMCSWDWFSIINKLENHIWYSLFTCGGFSLVIIQLKLKTPSFYNKTLLRHPVILRSLVATYRVIIDQNPSGILKSEPIGPGKWVVENFDSLSPGLLYIEVY